jgi:hypothetical protein
MAQVLFKCFGNRIMPGIVTGDELLFETDEIVTAYFAVEFGNVIERDTALDQKTEIFYFTKSLLGIFSRADFDQACLVGRIQVTGSFGNRKIMRRWNRFMNQLHERYPQLGNSRP